MSKLSHWAIPKDVMASETLTASAKLIYAILATRMNGKNYAWPSIDSLAADTGISKRTVIDSVNLLVEQNLVLKKRRGLGMTNAYELPDDDENGDGCGSAKSAPQKCEKCTSEVQHPHLRDAETASPSIYQKDQVKRSIKKSPATQSDEVAGVNDIFKVFYDSVNSAIKYGNRTMRKDAEWLIKEHGLEKAKAIAQWAISIQGQPFAPTITTPTQLRDKLGALKIFSDRLKSGANANLKPGQQWHVV